MPKYTEATAKLKATKLTKALADSGFSAQKLAEKEGVTVQAICHRLRKPHIQKSIQELLHKAGATDSKIARKLVNLMDAKKLQSCNVYVRKEADGSYKINENSNDFVEIEDNQAQIKAIELLLKVKRHLDPNTPVEPLPIQVNIQEIKMMTTEQLIESLLKQISTKF